MSIIVGIAALYAGVGLLVGLGFVLRGVDRVDPVAGASGWSFRVVILPGCVGLWPVVLLKWIRVCKGARA